MLPAEQLRPSFLFRAGLSVPDMKRSFSSTIQKESNTTTLFDSVVFRFHSRHERPGLTLLEVVVSVAIFLVALAAIGQLINLGSFAIRDSQWKQQGAFYCQSKLAEISIGYEPFASSSGKLEEDPTWNWETQVKQVSGIEGLWRVQVRFWKERPYQDSPVSVRMTQIIMDPEFRGSTLDPPPTLPEVEDQPEEPSGESQP